MKKSAVGSDSTTDERRERVRDDVPRLYGLGGSPDP